MLVQQMSVADAIERAIHDYPDRGAIETGAVRLTYHEFGAQMRRVVAGLEELTAPGEFVGIEADRSAGSIVAMVAALRSRRPFVAIDPRDSVASNAAKVTSLDVNVVARSVPGPNVTELVATPQQWHADAGQRCAKLRADLTSLEEEIGYAIHTSGSTGEPRCVLVAAEPLTRMVTDHVRRLSVGPQSRTLQFARLTFDGCITEILWTLTAGGCLVVLEESSLAPGAVLQSTLETFAITHLKTTPFALTATEPTATMSLQHVVNGGGACRPAVVGKWSAVAGFHNAYGLSETTVCNFLSQELSPDDCVDAVPLGELVGGCDYDIVAPVSEPDGAALPGSRGELVITGDSVAIGYLTERGVVRFVDDAGHPAYHTGDIVERRRGQLVFIERRDRQLKVRGYRLEPGEIESAACQLDAVVEAVVTAESHTAGAQGVDEVDGEAADALMCYYQGTADPRALRSHLEAVLDGYKVPSVITRIEQMPYTPNGKVDRDALRADRRQEAEAGQSGSVQEQVLELVRHLTGVNDAGIEDNFFDIGGDSASTVILVGKLKELGWTEIGVRDVLRAENLKVLIDQLHDRSG